MKPFDLEAAKRGERVVTRDGKQARIICFDSTIIKGHPLIVLVKRFRDDYDYEYFEVLYCYSIHGRPEHGEYDLFMAPKKVVKWMNIYKNGLNSGLYDTKAYAESCLPDGHIIATVKVEWEE